MHYHVCLLYIFYYFNFIILFFYVKQCIIHVSLADEKRGLERVFILFLMYVGKRYESLQRPASRYIYISIYIYIYAVRLYTTAAIAIATTLTLSPLDRPFDPCGAFVRFVEEFADGVSIFSTISLAYLDAFA